MLLKYIEFKPLPTWKSLCESLKLDMPPWQKGYTGKDPVIGLYPEDLFKYVVGLKLIFRMHFFDDEWQESLLKAPIMVLMTGPAECFELAYHEAHWIVLTQLNQDNLVYLDPWYTENFVRSMSFVDFKKYYAGIACQILAY